MFSLDDYDKPVVELYTLLQFCEMEGYLIPKFCYHEKLSVAGNCRMCLLEEDLTEKLLASCAVDIEEDMQIYTASLAVRKAREGVLEFLLINHPLDCPICDQGGECDLQDQTIVFGSDRGRYYGEKRAVRDKDFGPFVKTIMNRCIHCTRCIRFLVEVAGFKHLGMAGRGAAMEISTYVEAYVSSELSGNITDICPVGALTAKPYAFVARPWELIGIDSLDIFDACNGNIRIDVRGCNIMRIVPRYNEFINEDWMTDKMRYSYDALHVQRLMFPMVRKYGNNFLRVTWKRLFAGVKGFLISSIVSLISLKQRFITWNFYLGDLLSTDVVYLAHKLVKSCGSSLVARQSVSMNFMREMFSMGVIESGEEEEQAIAQILLVSSNVRLEAPLLNIKLRRLVQREQALCYSIGDTSNLNYYVKSVGSMSLLPVILKGKHWFSSCMAVLQTRIVVGARAVSYVSQLYQMCTYLATYVVCSFETLVRRSVDMAYNELITGTGNGQNSWQFYKSHVAYLVGFDDQPINKITVQEKQREILPRVGANIVLYQGHHNDINTRLGDLILPVRTFFEMTAFYLNMWGQLQRSSKIILTTKRKRINTDNTVIRMFIFMLSGILYKQRIMLKAMVEKVGLRYYAHTWDFKGSTRMLRITGACAYNSSYYLDNSMVRNSNVMAIAASYYEGDAWWLLS